MAFSRNEFAITTIAQGSNAPKLFTYRTTADNKAAVGGSGYFDEMSEQLRVGDFILTHASDGMEITAVAGNTAGVVTTVSAALA